MKQKVNVNMVVLANANRGPYKHGSNEQVAGDFFGPTRRIIERVAGEKLQENNTGQAPEQRECKPLLDPVKPQVDCLFCDRE